MVGIAAVVAEVTLSGFISVYFERVLKGSPSQRNLTVWDRNVQVWWSHGSLSASIIEDYKYHQFSKLLTWCVWTIRRASCNL